MSLKVGSMMTLSGWVDYCPKWDFWTTFLSMCNIE